MAATGRVAIDAAAGALRGLSFDQRMATGLFAAMALLPLVSPVLGGSYLLIVAGRAMIFAIAAMSLQFLIGAGGMVSFGHAAFLGIGAYAAGIAASHGLGTLAVVLPAALAASGLFALATGAIAVRTRGVYFIMITLAFGQMAFFVATSLAPYGGDDGLPLPGRTLVFGTRVLESRTAFFYTTVALAAATYVLVSRLGASRFGRVLRGLTDSELRMQAIGFGPYPFRLAAYVIAGMLCGLAGFLLGNLAEFVSPNYMHWQRSGELIVMVLLGGIGALYGPIAGALALLMLEAYLSQLTVHWKAILGPLLVLVVLFAKGGIAGAIEGWRRRRMSPAELLVELDCRARETVAVAERFARQAAAATRWIARRITVHATARWRQWEAVLRPRLDKLAVQARRAAAEVALRANLWKTALDRRTREAMARAEHFAREGAVTARRLAARAAASGIALWRQCEAVLRPRLDTAVVLARRGARELAYRAKAWRLAFGRLLRWAALSAEKGIGAALDRWRRR